MSNNHMDEQIALNLIAEFARNQTAITHQVNSRSAGITKASALAEKRLSERLLQGLIGRPLDGSLKTELARRLSNQ